MHKTHFPEEPVVQHTSVSHRSCLVCSLDVLNNFPVKDVSETAK